MKVKRHTDTLLFVFRTCMIYWFTSFLFPTVSTVFKQSFGTTNLAQAFVLLNANCKKKVDMFTLLKELGTSRTHSAVIHCLTICQHIPVVRKNHKNQLTQQFDIICCLARGLTLCIESKQIMSLLSCESATLKRGPQLCGQRCGPYLRH